jgi:hypothetical protein
MPVLFEELQASFAVHKTFGNLPESEQACLRRALIGLREGSLSLHPLRFFADGIFVTFACGFTIWVAVSRDGRRVAIEDLYRDPYANAP